MKWTWHMIQHRPEKNLNVFGHDNQPLTRQHRPMQELEHHNDTLGNFRLAQVTGTRRGFGFHRPGSVTEPWRRLRFGNPFAWATRVIAFAMILMAIVLWVAGCAGPNVNPSQATANTGYVDFHADSGAELSWDVARFDDGTQSFKSVFSELQPPSGGILRLPLAPGHHRLRVTFLNRVIASPAEVEVEVQNQKITPIRVTLTDAGTASVQSKDVTRGATMRGGYGQRTKISSDESVKYAISAMAEPSVPYQPRERMPYAR